MPMSGLDCGLHNLGNSCFMNSTLQILLHTVPLLNVLVTHRADSCMFFAVVDFNSHLTFAGKLALDGSHCFTCQLRKLATEMLVRKSRQARSPDDIFRTLKSLSARTELLARSPSSEISPTLRQYRQEDAHEFLRFSIDALQFSAQKGVKCVYPGGVYPKI